MLILSLLIPSYSELFLNKTRNGVRITLQTRHGIPNSYVNGTVICGTYLLTCEADYSVGLTLDNVYRISTYEQILAKSGSSGLALTRHPRSRVVYR